MKKMLWLTAIAATTALSLAALSPTPASAADPYGTWLTGDKKGKVRIVNCDGAICGTLVWLQVPIDPDTGRPKTDKRNADASKRDRPLLGVAIVLGMKPSSATKWVGKVYNAEDGNTYSGSFALTGANTADLKGCVMGGLLCKTQIWTRTK
jgi:uncharacterized protein (DUF2147 family)